MPTNLDLPFSQTHPPRFDGETYSAPLDQQRLTGQMLDVFTAMTSSHVWWTLRELAEAVGASEASCSARLRDARKPRFGSHTVERRRVRKGLWEYRLLVNRRLPL